MATANGVAPSHNVTLQAPLDERARGWFDIYYYYCYYLSPRDKKDKDIYNIIYDILWCNIVYYFKNILLDNEGDGSGKCVRYWAAAAYLTRRGLRYSASQNADRYRRIYKILLTKTYVREDTIFRFQMYRWMYTFWILRCRCVISFIAFQSPFGTVKMFQSQSLNVVSGRKLDIVRNLGI